MCDLCFRDGENNLVIEIKDVSRKPADKFDAGISALTKAFGYDSERYRNEVSPYRSVREMENESKKFVEDAILTLFHAIVFTWIDVEKATNLPKDTFILNNRIFLNTRTGKPLTRAQWNIIKRDILRAFNYIFSHEEERIALHALALGKVLKGIPIGDAITIGYNALKPQIIDVMGRLNSPQWRNASMFAQQHAGELIVELTNRQFRRIHDTIQNSIKNRHNTHELKAELFERFGELNRDWRRIAETEIGNSQNNGQLISELETREEGEVIFVRGIAAAGACPWCANMVDGKVFALLDEPPVRGDKVTIKGETYTAIWPGKDNYGRKRANWWVAAGTQHPHAILPGSIISTSLLSTVMQGFYKGKVVEITTESGSVLTVTDNHPVFTPLGFVKAKFLTEGMDVVKSTDTDRMFQSVNPYYYQAETLIEGIFTAAKHLSHATPIVMSTSPEDFHGDGRYMDKTINIVNAYGLLGGDLESSILNFRHKELFRDIQNRFGQFNESDFLLNSDWGNLPSSSFTGDFSRLLSSVRGGFCHSSIAAFRDILRDDVVLFNKELSEGRPTHSYLSGEFLIRFSNNIITDDLRRKGRCWDSPSTLMSDKIIHIKSFYYSGEVYDLTDDIYGLYTCNDIVVKNCRCTWVRYTPGFEKWDKKFREAIEQARERGRKMSKPVDDFEATIAPGRRD